MKAWPLYIAALAVAALVLVLRGPVSPTPRSGVITLQPIRDPKLPTVFWTTPGLEPDTCAAAWLLSRIVSPGAKLLIAEGSDQGAPFDVPGSELGREPGRSVSDAIVRRYAIKDQFSLALAAVARELELNPWTTNDEPFFSRIRAGLADALNASGSDEECLRLALEFLDGMRAWSASDPATHVPASVGEGSP